VSILFSRSVRRGTAGARHGNMRQRGEVVQCEAMLIEIWRQLSVAHTRFDGYGFILRIEIDDLVLRSQGQELGAVVDNVVEAMLRAQNLKLGIGFHKAANVFRVGSGVQTLAPILKVPRP